MNMLLLSLQGLGNSVINEPLARAARGAGHEVTIAAFANGSAQFFHDLGYRTHTIRGPRELARLARYDQIFSPFPSWKRELLALTLTRSKKRHFLFGKPMHRLNFLSSISLGPEPRHDFERNAELLEAAGIPMDPRATTLQWGVERLSKAALHPTASSVAKYYPLKFWRELMADLLTRYDHVDVFCGPAPAEQDFCRQITAGSNAATVCAGLGFRALLERMATASAFVGSDSALMHMAALLDLPVVGLWSFADFRRVYPYGNHSAIYIPREVLSSQNFEYPDGPPPYLGRAQAQEVMAILERRARPQLEITPRYRQNIGVFVY